MKKHLAACVMVCLFGSQPVKAADVSPALPATSYFPILPYGDGVDSAPQLLPIASNHPLDSDHTGITRALIMIHDRSRDANAALALATALAGASNEDTLILAPQFLLASDIERFAAHLPDQGDALARWNLEDWQTGGDSLARAPQKGISSFTALDLLMLYLGEEKYFPDLKQIVIAGHGAGGDFVLRYAALGQAPGLVDKTIAVRFVAANPSTFLYFTALRPAGKQGFAAPDAAKCQGYNNYPFGLEQLNDYARRTGVDGIRLNYPSKHVAYLVGEKEAAEDRDPNTSCSAQLEGPDRFLRAANYSIYLTTIFGDETAVTQSLSIIPGAGFDPAAVFGSRCGMAMLFGDGKCEAPAAAQALQ